MSNKNILNISVLFSIVIILGIAVPNMQTIINSLIAFSGIADFPFASLFSPGGIMLILIGVFFLIFVIDLFSKQFTTQR